MEPIATKSTTGHAAIAVNSPLGWANDSYAASGYARFAEHDITQRDTQLVAARALVGWSWLIADRAMISFAVGAASGYEFGQQTMANTLPEEAPMMTIDVGEGRGLSPLRLCVRPISGFNDLVGTTRDLNRLATHRP